MKKLLYQSLVSILIFVSVLFAFSRVDWLSVFHLRETIIEEKIGELYWDLFSKTQTFVEEERIVVPLDTLLSALCRANDISRDKIKLHVIESEEVNAFAFPGNHLVIYTSLLSQCKDEGELCGVMAHEIAHIEKGHVMDKLVKEIGLSTLVAMIGGSQGAEALGQLVQVLSSTAYSRTLEREADETAVRYLMKAGMNPRGLAEFLHNLPQEINLPDFTEWISTHPDSEERYKVINEIVDKSGYHTDYRDILTKEEWEGLKKSE